MEVSCRSTKLRRVLIWMTSLRMFGIGIVSTRHPKLFWRADVTMINSATMVVKLTWV